MKNLLFIVLGTLLLSSCATIITGTQAKININGQQQEPVDIATRTKTYEQVMLPYLLTVEKKNLDEKISVTSEHYIYQDFIPGKKINLWLLGNIVAGGFIGLGIDALTGAIHDAENKNIDLKYSPKENLPSSPTAIIQDSIQVK